MAKKQVTNKKPKDKALTERTVWNILDLLRQTTIGIDESIVVVIGQLLAWAKLSSDGKIPTELKFGNLNSPEYGRRWVLEVFEKLSTSASVGEQNQAFQSDPRSIERFGEIALFQATKIISSAVATDALDFSYAFRLLKNLPDRPWYGDFDIPEELAELAVNLIDVTKGQSVYCMFGSSFGIAEVANERTEKVFVEMKRISPMASISNILNDGTITVAFSDPIQKPSFTDGHRLRTFDVGFCFGPWGVKYRQEQVHDLYGRFPERTLYGEILHLRHLLSQTSNSAIAIVPDAILFRTSGGELDFKKDIVRRGWLKSVVKLPQGLFQNTSLACSILVFGKNDPSNRKDILFVNCSSDDFWVMEKARFSGKKKRTLTNLPEIISSARKRCDSSIARLCSIDECAENDFNLLPERYVMTAELKQVEQLLDDSETLELSDVATLIRAQGIRASEKDEEIREYLEAGAVDIQDSCEVAEPEKVVRASGKSISQAEQQRLKPGDLIIAIKGSVGKVGLVPETAGDNWIAGQSYLIARPNRNKIRPEVLLMYLQSELGQSLLESRTTGSTIKMIPTKDIRSLPVIMPDANEQASIAESFEKIIENSNRIKKLQSTIKSLKKTYWQTQKSDASKEC